MFLYDSHSKVERAATEGASVKSMFEDVRRMTGNGPSKTDIIFYPRQDIVNKNWLVKSNQQQGDVYSVINVYLGVYISYVVGGLLHLLEVQIFWLFNKPCLKHLCVGGECFDDYIRNT